MHELARTFADSGRPKVLPESVADTARAGLAGTDQLEQRWYEPAWRKPTPSGTHRGDAVLRERRARQETFFGAVRKAGFRVIAPQGDLVPERLHGRARDVVAQRLELLGHEARTELALIDASIAAEDAFDPTPAQRGVDVALAVDLLVQASDGLGQGPAADVLLLCSNDEALVHAVRLAGDRVHLLVPAPLARGRSIQGVCFPWALRDAAGRREVIFGEDQLARWFS